MALAWDSSTLYCVRPNSPGARRFLMPTSKSALRRPQTGRRSETYVLTAALRRFPRTLVVCYVLLDGS